MERVVVQCQQCKAQLEIVPSPTSPTNDTGHPSGLSTSLDESFLILEHVLSGKQPFAAGGGSSEGLDESFIVLQQHGRNHQGLSSSTTPAATSATQQRFSLDARMTALANVLELASLETDFDQPLCLDCAAELRRELETQVDELETEISAYAALEARLKAEVESGRFPTPMDDRQFARELKKAQEALAEEELKLERAKQELAEAEERCVIAQASADRLENVETKYWLAFNSVMLYLSATADFRDSLQQRVDAAERSIAILRRTNVLSSIFRIWFNGPYGTISGLRLGSTPENPVDWWEINAAWGQAVLLLDILVKAIGGFQFKTGRLEPRGSYPRIHDARGAAELFGPASKILCPSYDRAQVAFLGCLKEFAQVLAEKGAIEEGRPFSLKYPIDGDKVKGQSIRYGLSRDKAWTRALKYMLVDLKYCLKATVLVLEKRRNRTSSVVVLPREGPEGVAASSSTTGGTTTAPFISTGLHRPTR